MKRKRTGHHAVPQGSPVLVFMANGDMFVDRFEEKKGNRVRLRERGWLPKGAISSVTIKRGGYGR